MAEQALQELKREACEADARKMAAYHKVPRRYLGVRVPAITRAARMIRSRFEEKDILDELPVLWQTDIHEARILVGKLLAVRKICDIRRTWSLIDQFRMDFDAWAIADHLEPGARQCLKADRQLLDDLENNWIHDPGFWVRRAALVYTLFLAKPGADPERPLSWAAGMTDDREWFIQKAIGWWLRELGKHQPARVTRFLDAHGQSMKPFARREAEKYLERSFRNR